MRDISRLNLLKAFLGIATLAFVTPLFAQANPCESADPQNPANWSRVPQAPHADTLSPAARKAQDDYFSTNYPLNVPYLDPDELRGSWTTATASVPQASLPGRYWIVGTIVSYDVHEVQGKTIYTDLHVRVDRLADNHQDKPNEPIVGSIVDAGTGGGCLITASGKVRGRLTEPGTARTRIGHRYLIQLVRTEVQGLYEMAAAVDLTKGKAEPLSNRDVQAAQAGKWPYLGLDEDATIKRHKQDNPNN